MNNDYDITQDSNRVKKVEPSLIRTVLNRVDELRKSGNEIIALSAGEPDFNTPVDIKEATINAINQNHTHYSSNRGYEKLRKKISEKTLEETGILYDYRSEILVTSSGAEAINNTILSIIDEGDEAIIFSPAFVNYENMVKISGGIPVIINLKPENQFGIDIGEVKKHITEKTKMLVINNPNNPTGAVYDNSILKQLCELSIKHNFIIVSDEMYSSLVYDDAGFTSVSSYPGMKERSVIINGFSKTYAMTGWRLGYITASEKRINGILKIHQYSTTCSPTFIQIGVEAGMDTEHTKKDISAMIHEFAERRILLMKGLDKINGLSYVIPKGAFYIMVDVSETGLSGMEFASRLLEEKNVAVIPGVGLGKMCSDFIRISFAASTKNILEALNKIDDLIKELEKKN
ncbi:aminotransferase class I/II-fold pyridoxal phosphate-dependent enzyme [Anaerocolumna sedimenticola]|uniref:Aminotransferase n=1 Tax=Anaerocolumna sedimenticola TaxID=2696063 RepID=A0A6P1TN12_9FIRM|nr:pyridoxal phosphate-dependent aminotransferase [Anaerocolumna sedimenticola]QHQ61579.1 aminotransferase class I/II-fold pyridoxal phosphate-dependent enzyme [Anaerocolumna sedimenticola]